MHGGATSVSRRARERGEGESPEKKPKVVQKMQMFTFSPNYKTRVLRLDDVSWHSDYTVEVDKRSRWIACDGGFTGRRRTIPQRMSEGPKFIYEVLAHRGGQEIFGPRGIWGVPAMRGSPG